MGEPGPPQEAVRAGIGINDAEGPRSTPGPSQALHDDPESGRVPDLALGQVEEEDVAAVIHDAVQHHPQVRDGVEVETAAQGDVMAQGVAPLVERHDRVSTVIHVRPPSAEVH